MAREDQNSLGHRLRRNKGAESISRKTSSCTQRTEEVDPSLDQVTPKQSCEKDECKLSGRTFCSQASSASQGIHGGSSRRSRLLQRSHRIATTARTYRKDRVSFHDSAPPIGPSTGQSHLEHQTHRLGRLQGAYLDSWIGLFGSLIVSTLVGFSIFFLATSTIGMSGTFGASSTEGEVFFHHGLSTPRLTSMMSTQIPIRARKRGRLIFRVSTIVMPDDL